MDDSREREPGAAGGGAGTGRASDGRLRRRTGAGGIPDEYTPMAMIAIGYQAPAEIPNEETRNKELADRVRKSLAERFFEGQ